MAEQKEYDAVLQALLRQLEHPTVDQTALTWLGAQIRQQLQIAEEESLLEWEPQHPEDSYPETFLSPDTRLEIALEVMYHELVSLPRMLAHVQRFWASQPSQYNIRLIDSTTQEPIQMGTVLDPFTASDQLTRLRQFVQQLATDFQLDLLRNFLHRLENSDEH